MRRRMKKCSGIVALLVIGIFSFCCADAYQIGAVPHTEKLLIADTPHFRIIHQKSLTDSVPLLARYAEEAYAVLTEIYRWRPRGRIDLLYVDSLDTHNGWATVVPHNTILIYAAGAEPGSSIYAPGNDLRRTMHHELTHVLNMDMRFGYNRLFSRLFGKALPFGDPLSGAISLFSTSPAALTPAWYLEGQAIWAETQFAPPGRGESTFIDMLFRCAVRDDNLLPYSRWHLEIPHWPYGLGAYIYGARLIEEIDSGASSDEEIGALNEEIARGILFDSSRAARRSTGSSFEALSARALSRESALQRERLAILTSLPVTPVPRLTPEGMSVGVPVVLGSSVYFLAAVEEESSRLHLYDLNTGEVHRTASARTTPRFGSLSADRRTGSIVYTRLNIRSNDNLWYEVRRFDPASGIDSLVTADGRYRAVDVSPDGRRLAAVSQRGGKSHLSELPFDADGNLGAEQILLALPPESDLSSPRYSPDGAYLSYVEADRGGFRLKLFDTQSGSHRVIFASSSEIIAPTWRPGGEFLIFGSDLNGVFNLYEIDAKGKTPPVALTHVTGGLFFPAFSEDGRHLFAVSYDGFGPHLTQISYRADIPAESLPAVTLTGGETPPARFASLREAGEVSGREAAEALPFSRPYNSFSHIRFDYWAPWLTASVDGVQGGAGASFSDPSRFQDLKLLAGIESRYDTPVGGAFYTYRGIWPDIRLYGSAQQNFYYNLLRSETTGRRFDHAEETRRYGTVLDFPFLRIDRRITLELGYEYRDRRFIQEVADVTRNIPLSIPASELNEGLLWTRLNYFDAQNYGRSNSVEDGRLLSLGAEWSSRALGGELDRSRVLATWNEYLPIPWGNNHVLKLSAVYGFGGGDRIAQGLFGLGGLFDPVGVQTPGLPDRLPIRGYPSNFRTGERVIKAEAAYRFPILDLSRGREGAFPVYSRQIFAELFYEGGRTWKGQGSSDEQWMTSAGAEINYSLRILRYVAFAPGIGVAYAPERAAQKVQSYLTIKGWVNF